MPFAIVCSRRAGASRCCARLRRGRVGDRDERMRRAARRRAGACGDRASPGSRRAWCGSRRHPRAAPPARRRSAAADCACARHPRGARRSCAREARHERRIEPAALRHATDRDAVLAKLVGHRAIGRRGERQHRDAGDRAPSGRSRDRARRAPGRRHRTTTARGRSTARRQWLPRAMRGWQAALTDVDDTAAPDR